MLSVVACSFLSLGNPFSHYTSSDGARKYLWWGLASQHLQWQLQTGYERRLQTPPTPWFCVVGAENTVILGRQQRLLLALTVTLTLMKENVPQVNVFQSWSLLCTTSVCVSSCAPPTPEVGLGLKKSSNIILTSEQEAESQFLSKQPWKWKMLQLCALS